MIIMETTQGNDPKFLAPPPRAGFRSTRAIRPSSLLGSPGLPPRYADIESFTPTPTPSDASSIPRARTLRAFKGMYSRAHVSPWLTVLIIIY